MSIAPKIKMKRIFRKKNGVKFIDSFKFLNASFDKLVSYLDKDKLKIIRSEFCKLSAEDFDLLTRKGDFPYEYIDCVEKLRDTRLPPRELFFSSLTGDTVSESDYAHTVNVYQRFSIRTLGKYSDLYLKTDVLLLADIFENFRNSCIRELLFRSRALLYIARFRGTPCWNIHVRFELLTDIDMFIERGMRWSQSMFQQICTG